VRPTAGSVNDPRRKRVQTLGALPFHGGAGKPVPVVYGRMRAIYTLEIGGASDYAPQEV
jgi:hypothetical protein